MLPASPTVGSIWVGCVDDFVTEGSSIQKGPRPFLVLSVSENFLDPGTYLYLVVSLTTKLKKVDMPTHYIIEDFEEQGLKEVSMILAEQSFTVPRSMLSSYISTVNANTLAQAKRVYRAACGVYSQAVVPASVKELETMTKEQETRLVSFLVRLLKHEPERFGVVLDANHAISLTSLLTVVRANPFWSWVEKEHLVACTRNSSHFQYVDDRVRSSAWSRFSYRADSYMKRGS